MKKLFMLLTVLLIVGTSVAQSTYVPDDNFEQNLINLGYDDVLDDHVITSNISNISQLFLDPNIADLTGIEGFSSLEYLRITESTVVNLDFSSNTNLKEFECHYTYSISNIDVSNCTLLEALYINDNQLTSLDVTNCPLIRNLECANNQLSYIDVSNNPLLDAFNISNNQFTSIDVSNNPVLLWFKCNDNQLTTLNLSNNIDLGQLEIYNNNIASLDLTNNPNLWYLYGNNNQLTSLDLSQNIQLINVEVENNQLSSTFDLSNNVNLTHIWCPDNQITELILPNSSTLEEVVSWDNPLGSLDLTYTPGLVKIECWNNQFTQLDLSQNPLLEQINISDNNLAQIDLSNNTGVFYVFLNDNQLSSIDISNNPMLEAIYLHNNQLTSANLKNGSNTQLSDLNVLNNPGLNCIQVDDATWSTTNWPNKDATAIYSENCEALTYVPDDIFEQTLIDLGYDDVLDDYVLTNNINSVDNLYIGHINGIISLDGIQDFTALRTLNFSNNSVQNVNLSSLINLEDLICFNNSLVSINVSGCINLKVFNASTNNLLAIDLSNNTELVDIKLWENELSYLDISKQNKLDYIICHVNNITSIKLPDNSPLRTFNCSNNELTNLDLSNINNLEAFACNDNQLTSLNLRNGNNQSISSPAFYNNPNLTCIQVDDAAWSSLNWTNIDAIATFSENCGGNDNDGDGVSDDLDDYPNDPDKAFSNLFPATGYGSLGFEDLWPAKGDYDFNDLVVDYQFQTITNASNKVVEIKATIVVKASGASMLNGFGFNLPDVSQNLVSGLSDITVTGFDIQENYISLNDKGWENAQSKPTIIVFDDVYNILEHPGVGTGVNTEQNRPFVAFDTLVINITPTSLIYNSNDFALETWNPFMIVDYNRGVEVHLSDHPPTDLANQSLFGSMDDDTQPSINKYYKTAENLPYAINIVNTYSWPLEKVSIETAYLHFVEWAISSGDLYPNWHEDINGYRDDNMIYLVPE